MDAGVVAALALPSGPEARGLPVPLVTILRDADGKISSARDEIETDDGKKQTRVSLRPLRELFAGNAKAPDLSRGPTPELEYLFVSLEAMVVRYCDVDGRDETDQDLERIFATLKRRPDGPAHGLHSYLRATARLYMSVHDVSQAEYEAVMGRLAKSARTFGAAPISRNYVETLRETFEEMVG